MLGSECLSRSVGNNWRSDEEWIGFVSSSGKKVVQVNSKDVPKLMLYIGDLDGDFRGGGRLVQASICTLHRSSLFVIVVSQ